MEAHPPHVHHEGHKKTGWNYFYEFLMLFLAVFCGSLGEYQLEHVIEGQRERTFIQTLVRDLEQDTFDLNDDIPFWSHTVTACDSLRAEIEKDDSARDYHEVYRLVAVMRKYNNFEYHDRTIEQLKNGGNFRLIRNKKVSEALIEYDVLIKSELRDEEVQSNTIYQQLHFTQNKLFTSRYYANILRGDGKQFDSAYAAAPELFRVPAEKEDLLFEYYNNLEFYRNITAYRLRTNKAISVQAKELMELIHSEYHIE